MFDFNGQDLGPSLDLLSAFAEMGRIDDGNDFAELYGIPQAEGEELSPSYVATVAAQAGQFVKRYGNSLSEHALWILRQLSSQYENYSVEPDLPVGTIQKLMEAYRQVMRRPS